MHTYTLIRTHTPPPPPTSPRQLFQVATHREKVENPSAAGVIVIKADSAKVVRSVQLHKDQFSGVFLVCFDVCRCVTVCCNVF